MISPRWSDKSTFFRIDFEFKIKFKKKLCFFKVEKKTGTLKEALLSKSIGKNLDIDKCSAYLYDSKYILCPI